MEASNNMLVEIITIGTGTDSGGTLGQMYIDHKPFCHTLERPWKNNKPFISCVPPGRYKLKSFVSPSKGRCFYLEGDTVSLNGDTRRTHILIHIGNTVDDTMGCILVGECIAPMKDKIAVHQSASAMTDLIEKLGRGEHDLIIKRF